MRSAMGFAELLLLLFVVLLFFGARRLPALGGGLGKALRGFKDAVRTEPRGEPPPAKRELPPSGAPKP
jgi:sec-independent protein translocase protein TatA